MLHIVKEPLTDSDRLDRLLTRTSHGDTLLLIEQAVSIVHQHSPAAVRIRAAQCSLTIIALRPDLDAFGIRPGECIDTIEQIDYSGFVELTIQHPTIHCW